MSEIAFYLLSLDDIQYWKIDDDNNSALIYACKNRMPGVSINILRMINISAQTYNHIDNQ